MADIAPTKRYLAEAPTGREFRRATPPGTAEAVLKSFSPGERKAPSTAARVERGARPVIGKNKKTPKKMADRVAERVGLGLKAAAAPQPPTKPAG
jgi:hypothetical protein